MAWGKWLSTNPFIQFLSPIPYCICCVKVESLSGTVPDHRLHSVLSAMASSTLLHESTLIHLFHIFQKFVKLFCLPKTPLILFIVDFFLFSFFIYFIPEHVLHHSSWPEFFRQFNVNFNLLLIAEHILFLLFCFHICESSIFSIFHTVISSLRSHWIISPQYFLSYYLFGNLVKFYYLIISHALSSITSLYRFGLAKAKPNLFLYYTLSEVRLYLEEQGSPAYHMLPLLLLAMADWTWYLPQMSS